MSTVLSDVCVFDPEMFKEYCGSLEINVFLSFCGQIW